MPRAIPLDEVARLPRAGDNCAIAIRRLEAGTRIEGPQGVFLVDSTVLEGHRVAVESIPAGGELLSWGLPFGIALRPIHPGNYLCNASMLAELRLRPLDFPLPPEPNFRDEVRPWLLDEGNFRPGPPVCLHPVAATFQGYVRGPRRGVGTRNYVVVLGTTSRTASFARLLADRFRGVADSYRHLDGVVAVAHTEGGSFERPNNEEFLLRTLAGFMVHPNVGAVLAVDWGSEPVTNEKLRDYLRRHRYPLEEVPHAFLTLREGISAELARAEEIVESWLEVVSRMERRPVLASELKVALQCGGSDAFSGISANPLAAWVAREILRSGGSANLAETDELIGAEAYMLQNVKDLQTARRFLETLERFKERVAWHGHSAEGNPSGGNKFRGLYNLPLKSIGAAMKRHPEVRLDAVIGYGERMSDPGFYFMDSPGNDLESVAGQVASGANLIFFTTGNGSITNFPFVPTLKIVTTSRRYRLLEAEMDVNAGAYLEGIPLEELGRQTLQLTLEVASGRRTKGERAGHSQVSIWRDWRQAGPGLAGRRPKAGEFSGLPLPLAPAGPPVRQQTPWSFSAWKRGSLYTTDQVGLILPTSLCAGQVARLAAERLNEKGVASAILRRFVALPHTEGCGVSGGSTEEMYSRTMLGYLTHPRVSLALLLEHGCEKTHNDYFKERLERLGEVPQRFGWASIQLDGGIEPVLRKVEEWFSSAAAAKTPSIPERVGLGALRLALLAACPPPDPVARALGQAAQQVVRAGGTVIVPEGPLASSPLFGRKLGVDGKVRACLAYGQKPCRPGVYVMEAPTAHWVEILTGLGATGIELAAGYVGDTPRQGHPLIPLLQLAEEEELAGSFQQEVDLVLRGRPGSWPEKILELVVKVAAREYIPKVLWTGNLDFQFSRGLLGVSL